jgi:hypothetical protein
VRSHFANFVVLTQVTEEKTVVSSATSASLKAEDFVPTGQTAAALEANSVKEQPSQPSASSSSAISDLPKPPAASQSASSQPSAKQGASIPPSAPSAAIGPQAPTQTRERFAVISYNDYVLKHEQLLEEYSVIRDLEETQNFLFK